jgi:hypothetical protein
MVETDRRRRLRRAVLLGALFGALAIGGGALIGLRRAPVPSAPVGAGDPLGGRAVRLGPRSPAADGGAIAGRVLGPEGRGLAEAVVVLQREPRREERFPVPVPPLVPLLRSSDRQGNFRFDGLGAGEYSVTASAPGLLGAARAGIAVTSAAVTGIDLRLGRGGVLLSGRVFDASGGTIGGARVLVETVGARPGGGFGSLGLFATESDGQGRYQLLLAPGRQQLRASASGYTEAQARLDLRAPATQDFRLEPAAQIGGRVVTREGRQPVAGAQVVAVPSERRLRLFYGPVITDQEGVFRIDGLPADGYRLVARQGTRVGGTSQPIALASAAAVEDVLIEVAPGAAVAGTIRSQAGKPIAGARVQAGSQDVTLYWAGRGFATSDGDGRYRMEGLPPGEHRLSVEADGFIDERTELDLQGAVTRDFVLGEGAELSALVLTPSGRPAAGAWVSASTELRVGGSGGDGDGGVTDAEGRFRFKRLEPGLLTVQARLGDALGRVGPQPFERGSPTQVTVRLAPGARISGRVRWDDGKPAAGVEVQSHGSGRGDSAAPARSGPDGAFSLGPFFAGPIEVQAQVAGEMTTWGPGGGPEQAEVTLTPGEHRSGIELTLSRRTGSINGVLSGPDGQPLPGVVVIAAQERGGRPTPRFFIGRSDIAGGGRAITGGDGAFALEGLAPGTFTLWVTHPDYPELARPAISAGTRNLRLRLTHGGTLTGVVVTAAGQPLPAYHIVLTPTAEDPTTPPHHRLYPRGIGEGIDVAHPQGTFRLTHIPPGRYDVAAYTQDGSQFASMAGVVVKAGETRQGLRLVTGGPPPGMGFVRARVR